MFLTATATSSMTETLKGYLDDPTVLKGTMNHMNINFSWMYRKLQTRGMSLGIIWQLHWFHNTVCNIIKKDTAIIYTDCIADIAPIIQALDNVGIASAHYHGELNARAKLALYRQWANGKVQVMVTTKAFGMGINSEIARDVIYQEWCTS